MARAALTADEIQAFRQRAVAAATRLFADRGYDGVSMRAVAGELGCSAMTPYRYFENKDALFAAVKTEAFRRFADRQARAAAEHPEGQRLPALGNAYLQFARDEPEAYRIMFELSQSDTSAYPELEAEQKRSISYLVDAVARERDTDDPLTTAHLLWAQVHGMVSLHLAGKLIMGRTLEQLCATPAFSPEE